MVTSEATSALDTWARKLFVFSILTQLIAKALIVLHFVCSDVYQAEHS